MDEYNPSLYTLECAEFVYDWVRHGNFDFEKDFEGTEDGFDLSQFGPQ
jgi:hypothetical protein